MRSMWISINDSAHTFPASGCMLTRVCVCVCVGAGWGGVWVGVWGVSGGVGVCVCVFVGGNRRPQFLRHPLQMRTEIALGIRSARNHRCQSAMADPAVLAVFRSFCLPRRDLDSKTDSTKGNVGNPVVLDVELGEHRLTPLSSLSFCFATHFDARDVPMVRKPENQVDSRLMLFVSALFHAFHLHVSCSLHSFDQVLYSRSSKPENPRLVYTLCEIDADSQLPCQESWTRFGVRRMSAQKGVERVPCLKVAQRFVLYLFRGAERQKGKQKSTKPASAVRILILESKLPGSPRLVWGGSLSD